MRIWLAASVAACVGLAGCQAPLPERSVGLMGVEASSDAFNTLATLDLGMSISGQPTALISPGFDLATEGQGGVARLGGDGSMSLWVPFDGEARDVAIAYREGPVETLQIGTITFDNSTNRLAQAQQLDRFVAVWAQLSETQREVVRARIELGQSIAEAVASVAPELVPLLGG